VTFNTSQFMVATGLAAIVYYHFLPLSAPAPVDRIENLWAVPVGATVMYMANSFAVSVIAGLQTERSPFSVWVGAAHVDVMHNAAMYLLGFMISLVSAGRPWAAVLMALPAGVIYLSLKQSVQLIEQTISAVEAMADVVDRRDRYTFEHSQRVAEQAVRIARHLRLPDSEVETIRLAARVHDLGKIGVPDEVLLKPGRLTDEEFAQMKKHPEIGYEILSRFSEYRAGRELVLCHHERRDGAGYPRGLKGDQVPIGAQIISAADAMDAMTSSRPYRSALPVEHALAEMKRGRGVQWSDDVVDALEALLVGRPAAPAGVMVPNPT
jgi:HD-GYP domain-containing protein (c-di-GMP phosphodiesterase class II)